MFKKVTTALCTGILLMGLSACEKGPAEKAGKAIDDAASDVAGAAEDAGDAIKKKLDE